jgi:hypothetical protein
MLTVFLMFLSAPAIAGMYHEADVMEALTKGRMCDSSVVGDRLINFDEDVTEDMLFEAVTRECSKELIEKFMLRMNRGQFLKVQKMFADAIKVPDFRWNDDRGNHFAYAAGVLFAQAELGCTKKQVTEYCPFRDNLQKTFDELEAKGKAEAAARPKNKIPDDWCQMLNQRDRAQREIAKQKEIAKISGAFDKSEAYRWGQELYNVNQELAPREAIYKKNTGGKKLNLDLCPATIR